MPILKMVGGKFVLKGGKLSCQCCGCCLYPWVDPEVAVLDNFPATIILNSVLLTRGPAYSIGAQLYSNGPYYVEIGPGYFTFHEPDRFVPKGTCLIDATLCGCGAQATGDTIIISGITEVHVTFDGMLVEMDSIVINGTYVFADILGVPFGSWAYTTPDDVVQTGTFVLVWTCDTFVTGDFSYFIGLLPDDSEFAEANNWYAFDGGGCWTDGVLSNIAGVPGQIEFPGAGARPTDGIFVGFRETVDEFADTITLSVDGGGSLEVHRLSRCEWQWEDECGNFWKLVYTDAHWEVTVYTYTGGCETGVPATYVKTTPDTEGTPEGTYGELAEVTVTFFTP